MPNLMRVFLVAIKHGDGDFSPGPIFSTAERAIEHAKGVTKTSLVLECVVDGGSMATLVWSSEVDVSLLEEALSWARGSQ